MSAICDKCGGYIYTDDYCTSMNINHCICTNEPIVTQPQKQPFRCPVCNGGGTVPAGIYNRFCSTSYNTEETCRTCNGTGIVWG